jgi:chemotaxis protein MotA
MDITTLIGLILGFIAIVGGHVAEGGHVAAIVQPTAALIVLGGTIGAVCLSYPLKEVLEALKAGVGIFKENNSDPNELINQMIQFATKARKNGLISLESESQELKDPFFKKALTLVVDGVDPKILSDAMEIEIEYKRERDKLKARVFESAGGYAPTIGILGAVLGLIHVMQNLSDPSKLGAGIAVAFVATIYGVGLANLLFLPIGNKLKIRHQELIIRYEMCLKGVLAIQAGENPHLIREILQAYLIKAKQKKE